ncbi:MAG: class III poly(R)-hydroxyalkanoic acid synthase subunit PhaC [Deltaproteobacteria bacterium]|nr:class III poly(R)-hydroxyalkanoic acid synthase subunit PhaC [Deltaproteobacteria bacterium]
MTQQKIPVDLILKQLSEDADKAQERAQKASDVLLGALDTTIAATPYDVVFEVDRVKLKHYRPLPTIDRTLSNSLPDVFGEEVKLETPLLVVYALINRETMLDLQPGRSVVQSLLKRGIDVYMLDWGYPTRKDRYLTIDDHVNSYMDDMVDFILERHNLSKINLMGICMGGTFCVIYSALHSNKIKNLITTVTPTNFDTDQGLLHIWMKNIDADRMVDTYGNMPGDLMNFGFLLLNPARLMIDKYVGFSEHMDDKAFVENFIRMEKWIFDSPDVPGETFRQFLKDCYRDNLLIDSKMEVGGKRVNLKKITMPLLNFYGKYDHLVPPAACELLTSRVASKDTEDVCLDTGHIGIYVSSKCQKEFAPKIAEWLKKRDRQDRGASKKRISKTRKAKTAAVPRKKPGNGSRSPKKKTQK